MRTHAYAQFSIYILGVRVSFNTDTIQTCDLLVNKRGIMILSINIIIIITIIIIIALFYLMNIFYNFSLC